MTDASDPTHEALAAAQRTIEVLVKKVRAYQDGSASTQMHRQLAKAKERQDRNRQRQEVMRAKADQLEAYNAKLEDEVAERTRHVQAIVDNVRSGFFMVGPDLRVREGATHSSRELLGEDSLTGCSFPALLIPDDPQAQSTLAVAVEQVYDDLLPEEVSLDQLPTRFVVQGRTLKAEGRVVRGTDGEVESILFTLSDATALEEAQRRAQHNEGLIAILQQKEAFRALDRDTRDHQLANAREALQSGDIATLQRAIHTVKGNAASFGLAPITELVHEVESRPIDAEGIEQIEQALVTYLNENKAVLAIDYETETRDSFEVSANAMASLQHLIQQLDPSASSAFEGWLSRVRQRPASRLLGPLEPLVDRLADRLEKRVRFELVGGDVLVDESTMHPIFQNVTHLIRNSIDHGIEPPWERGDKPACAILRVRVAEEDERWVIDVEDDGRGIDTNAVTE